MTANTAQQVRPTGVEKKLRIIKINSILPSPHQTRIFPPDWEKSESTIEMVQSIKENGLFQPPLVRDGKSSGKIGKYILVAGERRLRCSKLAGLKEIPVIVTELSEKEAAKVTASENYHREDLSIIEEAAAIKVLIEAYDGDVKEVAAYIDKSEAWVKSWSLIADLEECWKKLTFHDPELNDDLWLWKPGHWRQIARLDKQIQKDLYDEYINQWDHFKGEMTIEELKDFLAKSFCKMEIAVWPLHSFKGLAEKTCNECYLRSDKQKGLFDDESDYSEPKGARCLSKECFEKKWCSYQNDRYTQAIEKYGKALKVGSTDVNSSIANTYSKVYEASPINCSWVYTKATKSDPKAIPVLMLDGKSAGKVLWKKKESYSNSSTQSKPETEEEKEELRKERLKKKREFLVVKLILSRFTKLEIQGKEYQFPKNIDYPEAAGEPKIPSLIQMSTLATIIGGEPLCMSITECYVSDDEKGESMKKACQLTPDSEDDVRNTVERLYKMCCRTISESLMQTIRNKYHIPQTYLKAICQFFELDHKVLVRFSKEAFPDKRG